MKPNQWALWVALFFTVFVTPVSIAAQSYTEGVDYAVITPAVPPSTTGDKVEVVEMFWYGCPHCYDLEPYVRSWLENKPAEAEFVRIPAVFTNNRWRLHAKAFYTAEVLGVLPRIHAPLFDALHREHRPLDSEQALAAFFAEHGVSEADFTNTFNSFAVETKVRRAADLSRRYQIDGVPVFIVNGKYRVTGSMAKSYENMLNIVNYLVGKEARQSD